MSLSDAAAIATIVSAVVVLAALIVALVAARWARDAAVAGKEAVEEGRKAADLSKEAAEIQRQNLDVARRVQEAAQATWLAIGRVQRHQQFVVELARYEYLLNCVTRIEATARNQNNDTFRDARNEFSDALDLLPTNELTRCHELLQAQVNTALRYSTSAKAELNEKIRDLRQRVRESQ